MRKLVSFLAAGVALTLTSACQGTTTDDMTAGEPATHSGPINGDHAKPAKPAVVEPSPLGCSLPHRVRVKGEPVVRNGAISARLCGGLVDNGGFNLVWPSDTLSGRYVDQLVEHLNRLKPYHFPRVCTLPLSAPFDLVLRYPDGSRVWLHGDTSGSCANVAVRGGAVWQGADGVLALTRHLIEQQRAAAPASGRIRPARCQKRWNDVSDTAGAAAVRDFSSAAVTACRYGLDAPKPGTITQSADGTLVTQTRVAQPTRFLRLITSGRRIDPCGGRDYDLTRHQDVLLVRDALGDVQVVSTTPCWPNSLDGVRRYPTDELRHAVAELLDRR